MPKQNENKIEEWEREEWGGWKFVSDMLDNPDGIGIYPTSKCYKQLYDFVCLQKTKAIQEERDRIVKIINDIPDRFINEFGDSEAYILNEVKPIIINKINPNK